MRPHEDHAGEHGHIERSDLIRIAVTAVAAGFVWLRVWEPFPHVSLVGIAGVLFGGYPIFREAFENIRERRMTMELSMTIALIAALCIGEFFTALIITLFVLVAEVLEGLTVDRGRRAIGDLLDLLPHSAWIVKNGATIAVPVGELHPGDRVLIRPGTRIPVDGCVVSGNSSVEEAAITGESLPEDKLPGSRVFAGTLNQTGAIEVEVENLGRDTAFGRIIDAVEQAEQTRAPIQRLADRLAGYLVYFALGSAFITLLTTHNVRSTISVIIVAGACGIAAGTPLAILGAIGRAARQGTIIKGGVYLEQLAKTDTILLDKTGTLTYGKPRVVLVEPAYFHSPDEVLHIAAGAERNSEHPLALAVLAAAQEKQLDIGEPSSFNYTPRKRRPSESGRPRCRRRQCGFTKSNLRGLGPGPTKRCSATLSLQLLQNCLMIVNTILIERTVAQEDLWDRLNAAARRGLTRRAAKRKGQSLRAMSAFYLVPDEMSGVSLGGALQSVIPEIFYPRSG